MPNNGSQIDSEITRRHLLQAAGGLTFMALTPTGTGLYAATLPGRREQTPAKGEAPLQTLFTALPYIQPGVTNSKLVDGKEAPVIAWQTNGVHADYVVE